MEFGGRDDRNARLGEWFRAEGNHKVVVAAGFIAKENNTTILFFQLQ